MAAMSVIGIDLGNESCYVAVAKAGGIETIANDYSLRATPACVAFSGKNRVLGVAAKNQQVTNMANTIYGFKRLLGRKYRDPQVTFEQKHLPYEMVEMEGGSLGIKVRYLDEEHIFTPEQCLAMLFTKLKDISETALQTPVKDCVISVPAYFTIKERQAILDAAAIADLNVLSLLNETTATTLAYGIYKQDLPLPEEKPRNVVFVDCGQSSLQVSICAFNKGKLAMLSCAFDPNLGGRNIDFALAEHFKHEFIKKYKIDASQNPRAYIRLLAEAEKLKKQMSVNSTTLPLNIECFMNDKDVHGEMKRVDMEEMCRDFFEKIKLVLEECLAKSGLKKEDIQSVEIVGGSTRIPAIKNIIKDVFGCTPSTTLNQDEAVSRGCALQCAILSPAVRVKDFGVSDVINYPISIDVTDSIGGRVTDSMILYEVNCKFPLSRKITLKRSDAFEIRAHYANPVPYMDQEIGKWIIRNVKPTADGRDQVVMVTFSMNVNGILDIKRATVDSTEIVESEPMEEDKSAEENAEQQPPADANSAAAPPPEENKEKKKKPTKKVIHLTVDAINPLGLSVDKMNDRREKEGQMRANDKQEKERVDARNALEEYVYELRNKLSSHEELALYATEAVRENLIKTLDQMETWLYEEGEDCQKQIYKDKLNDLKIQGDPIEKRRIEYERLPVMIEEFRRVLQVKSKAITAVATKDPKYAHLTEADLVQLQQAMDRYWQYVNKCSGFLNNPQRDKDPQIKIADVEKEFNNFQSAVEPILNKSPPKASPPKDAQSNDAQSSDQKNAENQNQQDASQNHHSNQQQNEDNMDVD
ncbi:Hsp70 protein [Popillia japonica]|uniref:Hsp70 protein n=1 Tax=Popillia japonica TaxID=7064 RepID=A0AAW1HWC5_POPJA